MKPTTDFLFSFNAKLSRNSKIWEKTKVNSALRFSIRLIANNVLPILYKRNQYKHNLNKSDKVPVVVSMTSFPARIQKVWITIESMLRQHSAPEKIILWLSRDQFANEAADLPRELIAQQARGLDIRFVDGDIRSHKKYYYAFREFNDKYIFTIDDDLLFPSTFILDTYECAQRHPKSVVAHFGSLFRWNSDINYFEKLDCRLAPDQTGLNLFFGSGGGTLFPPNRLPGYMDDISTIINLCPTADDIYLNALARVADCEVTFRDIFPLLSITNKNDEKLTDHNGYLFSPSSANADQLRALVAHTKRKWGCNPFEVK